jgi:SHS2 domain-containing protein
MVTFAHLGIDRVRTRLEECFQQGVLAVANADKLFLSVGRATDVDVSIDIEYNSDTEKLYRRFEEGTQLSDAEGGVLIRSGKLDEEDFKELQDFGGLSGVYAGGKGCSEQ